MIYSFISNFFFLLQDKEINVCGKGEKGEANFNSLVVQFGSKIEKKRMVRCSVGWNIKGLLFLIIFFSFSFSHNFFFFFLFLNSAN